MTQHLFAFTAGDSAARAHLAVSITHPFSASMLEGRVDVADQQALLRLETEHGGLYAWGAVPGSMNDRYYKGSKALKVDDFVVCVFEGRCRFVAKVTYKLESEALARSLWGEAGNGETWKYMFFLSRPEPIDVRLDQLKGFLPKQFMGFARVGDENTANILNTYGTLEEFVKVKLLGAEHQDSFSNKDTGLSSEEGYFLIRSNLDTSWGDATGQSYRFGSTVPNYKKLMRGGRVLVDRKSDGMVRVIGVGVLGPAQAVSPLAHESADNKYYECHYTEWRTFEFPRALPRSLLSLLSTQPGYNVQHAIRPLTSSTFDTIKEYMDAEPEELCLIGTEKGKNWTAGPLKQIHTTGSWAVWWSFKLDLEAAKLLSRPFSIYLNAGSGKITHRLICSDFQTAADPSGMVSPWPEHTLSSERGVKQVGPKISQICKTWVLVDKIEELSPALHINDFSAAQPWSRNQHALLNQNAFGYAYLEHSPLAKESKFISVADEMEQISLPPSPPFTVDDAMEELFMERAVFDKALRLLHSKKNIILQGSPGVGKTFVAKRLAFTLMGAKSEANVETVQFHQAYSYEDFIQGFRPKKDQSGFAIRDGVFHRFCERARSKSSEKFVFIIDEINRGNLGKIFGELLMLIEADKRSKEWGLRLAYADKDEPPFYVPDNVYLIGMMNTADRSLTSIDYALRRRFAFVQVKPGFAHETFKTHLQTRGWSENFADQISKKFIALNEKIAKDEELREGFCVGHSYFCAKRPDDMTDEDYLADIIDTEIRPLLEDYWFDKRPTEINAIIEELM